MRCERGDKLEDVIGIIKWLFNRTCTGIRKPLKSFFFVSLFDSYSYLIDLTCR